MPIFLPSLAVTYILIIVGGLRIWNNRIKRFTALQNEGIQAAGVITKVKLPFPDGLVIYYSFQTASGSSHEGKTGIQMGTDRSGVWKTSDIEKYKEGSSINILYLKNDPASNVAADFAEIKLADAKEFPDSSAV